MEEQRLHRNYGSWTYFPRNNILNDLFGLKGISSAETCLRVIRGKEYSGYDTLEVRRENVLKII